MEYFYGLLIHTIMCRLILLSSILILASGCRQGVVFHNHTGLTQGTTFNIVFQERAFISPDRIKSEIDLRLVEIDMSLSVYNSESLISAINRNEPVKIDSMFAGVFRLSEKISEMTGGLFDITVGPLVRAWGFGPDSQERGDPMKADSLLSLVGYKKIRISDGMVLKENPGMRLDLNAVAQGYSVDVICSLLDDFGISNYLVEIGGEVRVSGMRDDRLWRVGVDSPSESGLLPGEKLAAVIELSDEALATSGNYRKFFTGEDGVKYSHTIDPVTGRPARNRLLSATIVAPDAATADAFATACMVAGPEKAIGFIESYGFLEGFLIFSGDTGEYLTWFSEGLKGRLQQE